ncbi:unnamed protein product, partial [Closterium sp. NIES-65]
MALPPHSRHPSSSCRHACCHCCFFYDRSQPPLPSRPCPAVEARHSSAGAPRPCPTACGPLPTRP